MKTKLTFLTLFLLMLSITSVKSLTYTVNVPVETNKCYIIGPEGDWDNFREMQRVGTTDAFTIDIPGAAGTDWVQFASGPGWAYVGLDGTGNEVSGQGSGPYTIASWKNIYDPNTSVTYTVNVPTETNYCYIVSDITGGGNWGDGDFVEMQRVGTTDVFTINIPGATAAQWVQFASGPGWAYVGMDGPNGTGNEVTGQGPGPHTVTSWKAVYQGPDVKGDIHITANVPLGTANVFIYGDYNGWSENPTDVIQATKQFDGVFSFVFENVSSVGEYYLYNKFDFSAAGGYYEIDVNNAQVPRSATYPTDDNSTITVYAWNNPVITNDVTLNSDYPYNMSISDNRVKISNYHGILSLMNLTGQIVQQEVIAGDYVSPYLNHGIYILSLDNHSRKIMIRP
ncbi:MAG: hypothetical protein BWY08_01790 [Bacteroidetes bacterium ADurb.Bin174]|nr:MAG: hypothetical protein BWY08_01790 [Bacteroidetes bacterium ADurb.Bin174]